MLLPFRIDLSRRELSVNEQNIKLTTFEYTIIETLIRNAGKVVSKNSLMLQLYLDAELRESTYYRCADGSPAQKNTGRISAGRDHYRA